MCGFLKHANGILRLPLPPQEENFSYHDAEKWLKKNLLDIMQSLQNNIEDANYDTAGRSGSKLFEEVIWEVGC